VLVIAGWTSVFIRVHPWFHISVNWLSDKAIGRLRDAAETPDLTGSGYVAVERIGRGGMGVVWLARDEKLDRRVALKVLDVPDASGALAERLLREARILARLEHPGIVPVHDVGQLPDGRVFYTMKYVQGARLDKHLASVPALADRLRIVQRICEAVAFAHARGVLHRDLKPENIMVGPFGEVLVMDWGVAKVLRDAEDDVTPTQSGGAAQPPEKGYRAETPTQHGAVLGTPGYMAPEQARGEVAQLDARADVFSLGAILRFLATGRAPEAASTLGAGAPGTAAASGTAKAATSHSPAMPKALRAIIAKAMAQEPAARYASVTELAADLAAFLEGLPVAAYPEGVFEKAQRFLKRHALAVGLILAYAIVRLWIQFFFQR
jgi:serine/threonine protein kinase